MRYHLTDIFFIKEIVKLRQKNKMLHTSKLILTFFNIITVAIRKIHSFALVKFSVTKKLHLSFVFDVCIRCSNIALLMFSVFEIKTLSLIKKKKEYTNMHCLF